MTSSSSSLRSENDSVRQQNKDNSESQSGISSADSEVPLNISNNDNSVMEEEGDAKDKTEHSAAVASSVEEEAS